MNVTEQRAHSEATRPRWCFLSPAPEATRAAGCALADAFIAAGRPVLVVALCGPLGAGKTQFAKGLAEGLGIDPEAVASPTFTIAHQHRGFVHVDAYRIENAGELEAAGFRDWLDPGTLVAIEWADRVPEVLPRDHLRVSIERQGGDRRFETCAEGAGSGRVLALWRERLQASRDVTSLDPGDASQSCP